MSQTTPSPSAKSAVSNGEYTVADKESITLIWFDPKIETHHDSTLTQQRLREINDSVVFHTELQSFLTYIDSIENEKVFLVTSGACAMELLSRIHDLHQIDRIFIFCMKISKYQHLFNEHRKVVNVYTTLDSLCESIREEVDLVYKQMESFTFFHQHQNATKDLEKQSAEFLWFQLFNYIILHLPRDVQAQKQMLDICRHYYRDNRIRLQEINEFQRSYRPEEAISWYTKQSFLYKLVNKALRTEDIDQLYVFRFFISDLSKSLIEEHKKFLQSDVETLFVYRGTKLSIEELNKLKENQGKIISTNGFLSTSQCRSLARDFALKATKQTDTVSVLFQIECKIQELGNSVILADIAKFSAYPQEKEVLFNLSATFRLETIEYEGSLCIINMVASTAGQNVVHDYIEITRRETEEKTVSIMFGRLMCDMGQYQKSLKYFEQLLMSGSDTEDLAMIELNIGRALYHKGEWKSARDHFDRAYKQMMDTKPPRIKESAYVLNSIGTDLQRQKKYDEAHDFFRRALTIRQEAYSADHPNIAQSLHNIGNVLDDQGEYDDALKYYREALQIRENYYPTGHPYIACSLNNIAIVLKKQRKYIKSLEFFHKALVIYQEHYPKGHPDIATSLYNIATIYEIQRKYDDALKLFQKALNMYEQCYTPNHPDITASRTAIKSLTKTLKE